MKPPYKGFIFDLDGTLYNTSDMDRANKAALIGALAEWSGTTLSVADAILEKEVGQFSRGGGRPSLYGAALSIGVPDALIEKWQIREIDPSTLLSSDPILSGLLLSLSARAKLALLTNTRTSIARQAVEALGIDSAIFSIIRGGESLSHPKPSKEALLEICALWKLKPEECVSVGDRWSVDLQPAEAIGMEAKPVDNRDELVLWLQALDQAKGI